MQLEPKLVPKSLLSKSPDMNVGDDFLRFWMSYRSETFAELVMVVSMPNIDMTK